MPAHWETARGTRLICSIREAAYLSVRHFSVNRRSTGKWRTASFYDLLHDVTVNGPVNSQCFMLKRLSGLTLVLLVSSGSTPAAVLCARYLCSIQTMIGRLSHGFAQIPDWRAENLADYRLHDTLMSGFAMMQHPTCCRFSG